MRIGVVGDTHSRFPNVERIVNLFREAKIERIVHTGDFTEPPVLALFAQLDVPLLGVFGNNDAANRDPLRREADRLGMEIMDPPHALAWAGRQILVLHDPEETPTSLPPRTDLVLHGHTHRHRNERQGDTLFFNPGECAGMLKGHNAVGVVDLQSLEIERLFF